MTRPSVIPALFLACLAALVTVTAESREPMPLPTRIEPPLGDNPWNARHFASFLNANHPGNRVGYRFHEHLPLVAGEIPGAGAAPELAREAEGLERQFAGRPGLFTKRIEIAEEGWTTQTWTFHIAPRADGFDTLWVIETGDKGLNEFYAAQECFRLTGLTNKGWRRKTGEAPAFSEYDLWKEQDDAKQARSSLTWVRLGGQWAELPPTDKHVAYRTPLGVAMDGVMSKADREKMKAADPYGPTEMLGDVDTGLALRMDKTGEWVCGLFWERTIQVTDHHPADCLHAVVNLGPLPPHAKRAIRGRIYWMKGSKEAMARLWSREFGG